MNKCVLNVQLLKNMKKIAVIDTGINLEYRDFKGKNIEIVNIKKQKIHKDLNGHGTSCCGEILKYNPIAPLVIIPILDESCTCSLEELYNALLYCNDREDIGIVNLSLSCNIDNDKVLGLFEFLINKMNKNGKILLASNKNKITKSEKTYPYDFENVLGVTKLNKIYPRIIFDKKSNKCHISSDFYFMPSINKRYKIFYGNSSLTAKMTGLLSNEINQLTGKEISLIEIINSCNKRLNNIFKLQKKFYLSMNSKKTGIQTEELNKIWSIFISEKDERAKKITSQK